MRVYASGWGHNVDRDTVKICEGSSYRRCLLGMMWQDTDVVIGRDLEPQKGMAVRYGESETHDTYAQTQAHRNTSTQTHTHTDRVTERQSGRAAERQRRTTS